MTSTVADSNLNIITLILSRYPLAMRKRTARKTKPLYLIKLGR